MTENPGDDLLLSFLASCDVACPACGQGLRGVPEARCPECAAPLHLEVASVQTSPGPWLFAVCAWTLALGFDGVVALIFIVVNIALIVTQTTPPAAFPYIFLGTFLSLSAASAVGLHRVITTRTRWLARPRGTQWRDAIVTFVAVAIVHSLVGATFFLAN